MKMIKEFRGGCNENRYLSTYPANKIHGGPSQRRWLGTF
jgi:hypothetical protein